MNKYLKLIFKVFIALFFFLCVGNNEMHAQYDEYGVDWWLNWAGQNDIPVNDYLTAEDYINARNSDNNPDNDIEDYNEDGKIDGADVSIADMLSGQDPVIIYGSNDNNDPEPDPNPDPNPDPDPEPDPTDPDPTDPDPTDPDPNNNCPADKVSDGNGGCECKEGTVDDGNDGCVSDTCPNVDEVKDVNGNCVKCKETDSTGKCIPCDAGKIRNAAGKCVEDCTTTNGYIHTSAFSGTVSVGENTIADQDNFRNSSGAIDTSINCDTGKINKGDIVNVISATVETRTYIKSDGTTSTSTYYAVSYKNCEGNKKDNADYDPDKPCSNCVKGNPLKIPEVAAQLGGSGIKGGMWGKNRNSGAKWHYGIDLISEYGDPIYAMLDGTATLGSQSSGAGYYVIVTSIVNGNTITSLYFHMQDSNRVTGSVNAGDIIGYQGDSGNLKGAIEDGYAVSHLHVKMKENGTAIDPENYMKTTFNDTTGVAIHSNDCD